MMYFIWTFVCFMLIFAAVYFFMPKHEILIWDLLCMTVGALIPGIQIALIILVVLICFIKLLEKLGDLLFSIFNSDTFDKIFYLCEDTFSKVLIKRRK